jgi:hypothetical protein
MTDDVGNNSVAQVLERQQMRYPFVSFGVNKSGELVISHQRDPQRTDPLEMQIPLAELEAKGFDDAARAIGTVTLELLSKWYPDQFAGHAGLQPRAKRAPSE